MAYEIGPHRVEGISVFYRAIAGAVGGGGGALVLFMGMLLGDKIIQAIVEDSTLSSPLATFFVLAVVFIATLASNGLGAFLIGLSDTDKYTNIGRGLLQILIVNIIIFLFTLPVYFVVKGVDVNLMIYVAAVQFIFAAMTSALVFEILASDRTQILLNLYSVILSIFAGLLIFVIILFFGQQLVLFFAMPVILWSSIGFTGGLISYFYYQLYLRSGVDFLHTEDRLPDLSQEETEGTEEEAPTEESVRPEESPSQKKEEDLGDLREK